MDGTRRQRGERRRRIIIEESGTGASAAVGPQASSYSPQQTTSRADFGNYTDDALAERQPRLCDLIPWRMTTLICVLLGGVTLIVAVECLFVTLWQQPGIYSLRQLRPFDPRATGSLANWLGSGFLILAAFLAVQVYLLRRHRHDDYRGYYRGWLWVAAVFVCASLDATTGLHQLLPTALCSVTGMTVYGDGTIWWLLVAVAAVGVCTFRSVLELRYSPLAAIAFGIAMTGYTSAALMLLGLVSGAGDLEQVVVSSASVLAGHFGILLSVACYSRHVFLDAQGMGKRSRRTRPMEAELGQGVEAAGAKSTPDVLAFPSPSPARSAVLPGEQHVSDSVPDTEDPATELDDMADDVADNVVDNVADNVVDNLADDVAPVAHAMPEYAEEAIALSSPPKQRLSKSERRRRRKQQRRRKAA